MIHGQNFARQNPDADGETFEECNFSQRFPGTALLAKNCIFRDCNLTNCTLDGTNTVTDCNLSQPGDLDA